MFGVTITLNMKVTVIEIKHQKLKIILIKLDHTYHTYDTTFMISQMISKNQIHGRCN